MARSAVSRGFLPTQVHVTGYGIDPQEVASGSEDATGSVTNFDGIFVGRVHAQKGLDDLVLVWRQVLEVLPHARLAVIGDGNGTEARRFKASIEDLGSASARLLGPLTGREKFRHLMQARVFIFPSHYESWGLAVLEAMAADLPVVGYDLPSSREAFGDAMVMVPLGDTGALADAVIALLNSDQQRAEYVSRGRRLVEKYDWNRISRRLVASL
jgi:glycosyltransferase involved in cell wall biosynthesis